MKPQNLFRAMHVMVVLVSFISTNQLAHSSTSSVDKLDTQISERNFPEFQDILQAQPTISLAITPQSITMGEMATVAVKLNNVPVEGYTSIEITCTYYPDLIEARDIVVADLFGADPVVAIRGPQYDHFIVAIAGSHSNKATNSGTVMTFHVRGLQRGLFPLECQARVSTGNHALTNITSISNDILVLGPTPTSTTGFCDSAEFIADVNVPPGTVMAPGAQFKKTWRLMNVGTCTWTTSYQLVFFSGEQMGTLLSFNFPVSVSPGQAIDLSLDMTAPLVAGSYTGNWMFKNANGALFGIGPQANQPFSVNIMVSSATSTPSAPTHSPTPSVTLIPSITPGGPTATPIAGAAFDFAANVCTAVWFSGAGQLPCPGIDDDPKGFVLKLNNPVLETGVADTRPGLLTFPQNVQNGYIQGFYPPFHVQSGDRFQSMIGCEGGAPNCYVAFRLDYQVGSDYPRTFWGPFLERYDGQTFSVNIDLSPLAGKDVKFILTILAVGTATGDRALWVAPIIYRPNPAWTLTPSATPAADWLTFTNRRYSFEFKYPPPGPAVANNDTFAHISLPFVQGTTLQDKSLYVSALENVNTCMGGPPLPQSSQNVTINGITFLKQTGQDSGAGHLFRWASYSTPGNNVCVSLTFMFDSINPGLPATPQYDEAIESAIFEQIVATYRWLKITPTITPQEPPTYTPTPVFTLTPFNSPTFDPQIFGALAGQVLAGKQVNISLFDTNHRLVISVDTNSDGTYNITAPAGGTYTVVATANGYLNAQGFATVTTNTTTTMASISLEAGDINGNNVIDQYDALTIGMNYNTALPSAADLNSDGIINVLDLELLARNYRKTGPVVWESQS